MRTLLLGIAALVACGHDGRTTGDGSVGGDGSIDGSPGSGELCGGLATRTCGATEYCDFPTNTCGTGDQSGICRPRPAACPQIVGQPACGCDNLVHISACAANMAGFDINANASCPVPKGSFACGYTQCDLSTHYCLHEPHPDAADVYVCVGLPMACASVSCACLANERCGNACSGSATAGLTLNCP